MAIFRLDKTSVFLKHCLVTVCLNRRRINFSTGGIVKYINASKLNIRE